MLAFAWPWNNGGGHPADLHKRMAASLCAGIGGQAEATEADGLHFAYRPLRSAATPRRRPARLPDGRLCAFHGYFDNLAEIAVQLGLQEGDAGQLYGRAVERWGDDADRKVVGEYCAIIAEPNQFA